MTDQQWDDLMEKGTKWVMAIVAVLFVVIPLSGCVTPIKPEQCGNKIVTEKCVKEVPKKPITTSDQDWAKLDDAKAVSAMWLDRAKQSSYIKELEALIEGCK